MNKKRGKKGEILVENIIFIVLNILFLAILVIFLMNQGKGTTILEDSTSKEIALLIDSAKPGMIMSVNLERAKEVAEGNGMDFNDSILIKGNYVIVKMSEDSGKSYHFFNDININYYPEKNGEGDFTGFYTFTFEKKT